MKEGKRFTTVNTDAGVRNGKAFFAYLIRCEHIILKNSREFKIPIKSSNEAELAAIISALNIVVNTPYLRSADILVINCDNTNALNALRKDYFLGWSEKYAAYYRKFKPLLPKNIYFRHVKGHSDSKKGARYYVNNWCDKEIRKFYK